MGKAGIISNVHWPRLLQAGITKCIEISDVKNKEQYERLRLTMTKAEIKELYETNHIIWMDINKQWLAEYDKQVKAHVAAGGWSGNFQDNGNLAEIKNKENNLITGYIPFEYREDEKYRKI